MSAALSLATIVSVNCLTSWWVSREGWAAVGGSCGESQGVLVPMGECQSTVGGCTPMGHLLVGVCQGKVLSGWQLW